MPKISCLIVSHNKPDLLNEAVGTVLIQDMVDWEAIIMDSGMLFDSGYFFKQKWHKDKRIKVYKSGENEQLRQRKAMAPWCFNECFRRNYVSGELVVYLCDDDVLYPHAFSTFANYANLHPKAMAMYASQDVGAIFPDGRRALIGERLALGIGGKCCAGRRMDCAVDYGQFCHRRIVMRSLHGSEYWPEAKTSGFHADGLFMEKVGAMYPIYPIDIKVGVNRRTPQSFYAPTH
jgi:glycosyltransferase involved in cell wall biosynthesis